MSRAFIASLVLLSLGAILPQFAHAQTAVSVTGTVVSAVSASKSTFVSDLSSLPADGTSSAILTLTAVDSTNQPLPDKSVRVTSNRGQVDEIRCYTGSTLGSTNTTATDANGVARCAARSLGPGNATFSVLVDDQVTVDDKPVVTFTPLPILQKLQVTVQTPGGHITILNPPREDLSHAGGGSQLINTGVNVEISFGAFMAMIFSVFLLLLLFGIILYLIRRIRRLVAAEGKARLQEEELIGKILALEQLTAERTATIQQKTQTIEQKVDQKLP